MYQDYAVGEHKALKGARFLNYIIDLIFYIIVYTLFITTIQVIEELIFDDYYITDFINSMPTIFDRISPYLFYFLVNFIFEKYTNGRSIGKIITGSKVVMIDGSEPTTKDYLIRNLCRVIPFDALTFLGSNGWHDKISKTTVVNKKAFEAEQSISDSINELGKN